MTTSTHNMKAYETLQKFVIIIVQTTMGLRIMRSNPKGSHFVYVTKEVRYVPNLSISQTPLVRTSLGLRFYPSNFNSHKLFLMTSISKLLQKGMFLKLSKPIANSTEFAILHPIIRCVCTSHAIISSLQ